MNKKFKFVGPAVAAAIVGVSFNDYLKVRRTERAKREEIKAHTAREIHAIRVGSDRLIERIENGNYEVRGVSALLNDFQFEIIAAHYE